MYIKSLKSGRNFVIAKIYKLFSGRYGFETKLLFKENSQWIPNINMPIFESKENAEKWITEQPHWRICKSEEQAAG